MSEILCDCCKTEGDHPSRIICDACFASAMGRADCCIVNQAKNDILEEKVKFLTKYDADVDGLQAENEMLKGEKPIPYSWWKDCPGLAQRTMERIITTNDKLYTENKQLDEDNIELATENARIRKALFITSMTMKKVDENIKQALKAK